MCGIAGVWAEQPLSRVAELAARLDATLAHRGPDAAGHMLLDEGRLVLAHRRLAIIDTSEAAAQPMTTADGRHTLVFNGEIYNHAALRRSLESDGERFSTASDTEVLLRLLARRGLSALNDVRGMFALGWWDGDERSLVIARDRFGIKPCYWSTAGGRVGFASEVHALRRAGFDDGINPAAILAYLRWGAIPAPLTWASGIQALEPGTWRKWRPGHQSRSCFADARELWRGHSRVGLAELRENTRAALRASVEAHLVADVPVGLFLSGGIDSSALVATTVAHGLRPRTFTVVFDETTHDESAHATCIARQFETDHHTLRVDARAVIEQMPRILKHIDQPTIDGINTYVVSGAVAATGIKAVLSGLGGDELFGGYPSFRRMTRSTPVRALPRGVRVAASQALRTTRRGWRAAKLAHAIEHANAPFEVYRALRGWMMPDEIAVLAGPRVRDCEARTQVDGAEQDVTACEWPEMLPAMVARLESTMYLRQQLLRDADVMSMAHGLEVRVPFVDHELIGAVWPGLGHYPHLLPGKKLLVESLPRPLPAAVTSRPKQGFTLPFEHWMEGALSDFVADGLAAAMRDGWIAPDAPAAVARAWKSRTCHWSRPWGLAMLGHFLAEAHA